MADEPVEQPLSISDRATPIVPRPGTFVGLDGGGEPVFLWGDPRPLTPEEEAAARTYSGQGHVAFTPMPPAIHIDLAPAVKALLNMLCLPADDLQRKAVGLLLAVASADRKESLAAAAALADAVKEELEGAA